MATTNLEKEKWFFEQYQNGRIAFNGEFFFNTKTDHVYNSISSKGYIQISLLRNDESGRKVLTLMAHRLIWIITYGIITDAALVINHIDGNKTNNKLSNLELVTVTDNLKHAIATKLVVMPQAQNKVNSVFTNQQVQDFRRMYQNGEITQKGIANIVGCNRVTVQYMLVRKTYKTVV